VRTLLHFRRDDVVVLFELALVGVQVPIIDERHYRLTRHAS